MPLPRDFYGNRSTDEALLIECGPRVVACYDEEFAIENRFIKATGIPWRWDRQVEWGRARALATDRVRIGNPLDLGGDR